MTMRPAAAALCALIAITGCGELLPAPDRTQAAAVAAGQAAEVTRGEDTTKCDSDVENDVVGGNSADPKNGGSIRREPCDSE